MQRVVINDLLTQITAVFVTIGGGGASNGSGTRTKAQRESGRGDGARPYCGRYAERVDAPGGELPSCPIRPPQGRGHDAARANGPPHLPPLQGRLRILQHFAWRGPPRQRSLALSSSSRAVP